MNMEHKKPQKKILHVYILLVFLNVLSVVLSLTCNRAEYQIPYTQKCCPMCPAGNRVQKHCTEFQTTSCRPCDEGTYMDEPTGNTRCLSCKSCSSGSGLRVKTSCTLTSDTVCEPQEGHYCVDPQKDDCALAQKHKHCLEGFFIQQQGSASADTMCSKCSEGTFSNGTLTSCQPHTQCEAVHKQTVKAGTSGSDAECAEKSSNGAVIGIITVVSVVLVLGAVGFIIYRKRKKKAMKCPDFLCPKHIPQHVQEDTELFPDQPTDIVPPVCPRSLPEQMPEPLLDVEKQRLNS